MKALVRYMPSEPMSFFAPEAIAPRVQKDVVAFERNCPGTTANVQVLDMSVLPALMQNTRFLAFHDMTGPFLHRQAYIRAQFGYEQFPATTLIHGISYNFVLWDMIARMLLASPLSCDSRNLYLPGCARCLQKSCCTRDGGAERFGRMQVQT